MRKLSSGLAIDPKTFAPRLVLMLDGVATDTTFELEAAADVKALHGPIAEQAFIDMAIDNLTESHSLTADEQAHFKANFRDLIKEDRVQLD